MGSRLLVGVAVLLLCSSAQARLDDAVSHNNRLSNAIDPLQKAVEDVKKDRVLDDLYRESFDNAEDHPDKDAFVRVMSGAIQDILTEHKDLFKTPESLKAFEKTLKQKASVLRALRDLFRSEHWTDDAERRRRAVKEMEEALIHKGSHSSSAEEGGISDDHRKRRLEAVKNLERDLDRKRRHTTSHALPFHVNLHHVSDKETRAKTDRHHAKPSHRTKGR